MKSHTTIEMEPSEYIATVELFKFAMTEFARAMSVIGARQAAEDLLDGADHFVPEDDADPVDLDAAPSAKEREPDNIAKAKEPELEKTPFTATAHTGAAGTAAPSESASFTGFTEDKNTRIVRPSTIPTPPADHPLVLKGRKDFYTLVEGWIPGFEDENAPQPDRGDLLRRSAATAAGPILAYLRNMGGLIAGTREYVAMSTHEGTIDDAKAVRIATNIAQVGSVLAPEFTDMLEFVRPDGTVIPHVRYEQVRIPQE